MRRATREPETRARAMPDPRPACARRAPRERGAAPSTLARLRRPGLRDAWATRRSARRAIRDRAAGSRSAQAAGKTARASTRYAWGAPTRAFSIEGCARKRKSRIASKFSVGRPGLEPGTYGLKV